MKKTVLVLLCALLIIPVFGTFKRVEAQDETACGYNYEVAYIEDNGSFTKKGCYSTFADAKQAMKSLGGDHVVRHYASLSPSRIIAMNSGLAYSYPGRGNSKTLNIYQDVTNRTKYYKQTYIANHYEMYYYDTERYFVDSSGKGVGMIQVNINGFEGFTDLEYTDLVPSKFLDNGIALYLGGNNTYENEDPFLVKAKRNYYEAVQNGKYYDLVYHFYRAYPKSGTEPVSQTIAIGEAPSSMVAGVKYYSKDGVNFYANTSYSGECITYYNYYQYLPLRSKTEISASTLNSYLNSYSGSVMAGHGQDFIDAQNSYGINALILFAMACHESSYGRSNYARNRNNLFGWNAHDSNPGNASSFASVTACINEQAGINLRGYVDITDGRFFSSSLGNKGSGLNVKYASDPNWGAQIAAICYSIDKYSKNKNGSYTDYGSYSLSVINTFDVEVKLKASNSSKTLYTTQYGPYYQKDFIVITLGNNGSFTKIQSTNAIDENGNIKTHRTPPTTGDLNPISTYDYDLSVAYIKSEYLTPISGGSTPADIPDEDLSILSSVDSVEIRNGCIVISGCAFIKGISFADPADISHKILLKNISDGSAVKEFSATTVSYPGISFNDSHTYTYVGYNVSIPLAEIEDGNYYLAVKVDNSGYSYSADLISYNDGYANMSVSLNDMNYHLSTNEIYNYRLEVDADSLPAVIDYAQINKPSTRLSLFSFDSFDLDENGDLYIYGQAMIYYCNYDDQNSIHYTVYLIKDSGEYLAMECDTLRSNYDYKTLLNSSFNMDYICFEGSVNIKGLEAGDYQMIIKIQNGEYVDFLEMSNISHSAVPEREINGTNYRFFTSGIRERLMLEVE
ncbi:MAG: glucosaminidase domain-containing protein [Erysipelotrichaceae bacterium]|nr:glucosaminidase domain-containing protein [Erysipelotrichaceae bacterium]